MGISLFIIAVFITAQSQEDCASLLQTYKTMLVIIIAVFITAQSQEDCASLLQTYKTMLVTP